MARTYGLEDLKRFVCCVTADENCRAGARDWLNKLYDNKDMPGAGTVHLGPGVIRVFYSPPDAPQAGVTIRFNKSIPYCEYSTNLCNGNHDIDKHDLLRELHKRCVPDRFRKARFLVGVGAASALEALCEEAGASNSANDRKVRDKILGYQALYYDEYDFNKKLYTVAGVPHHNLCMLISNGWHFYSIRGCFVFLHGDSLKHIVMFAGADDLEYTLSKCDASDLLDESRRRVDEYEQRLKED